MSNCLGLPLAAGKCRARAGQGPVARASGLGSTTVLRSQRTMPRQASLKPKGLGCEQLAAKAFATWQFLTTKWRDPLPRPLALRARQYGSANYRRLRKGSIPPSPTVFIAAPSRMQMAARRAARQTHKTTVGWLPLVRPIDSVGIAEHQLLAA